MVKDKFAATWVSHSSISDFLKCPRAYYLNNVYKDPSTGHKINLMSPPLALGQAVHDVVESLAALPVNKRFSEPLSSKLEISWSKVSGLKGGFPNQAVERSYFDRAKAMLKNIVDHPGPIKNLAVKINMDLPYFWLSEEDDIILCGKIDWLEYLQETDSVHIIDFKTGKSEEDKNSLQLPIYYLLATNCQGREVKKASYWYIERATNPQEKPLPDLGGAKDKVLKIAKEIKLARKLNRFKCSHKTGCAACKPLERVIAGEAQFVGVDAYNQDIYILPQANSITSEETIH